MLTIQVKSCRSCIFSKHEVNFEYLFSNSSHTIRNSKPISTCKLYQYVNSNSPNLNIFDYAQSNTIHPECPLLDDILVTLNTITGISTF